MSIKRTSKFIFTAGVILTILTSIFHMSALVSAQTISDDPIATAQQYLDKATVKHSFKSSKSLQEAKDFLSTKSYENGSSLGIIKINVGLNTLDIPVNLDLAIDNNKFNEQVTQFKNTILEDLLRIKTDSSSNSVNVQTEDSIFGFDYNPIEISKKFSVDELNLEIKNSPTSTVNFNINSVLLSTT